MKGESAEAKRRFEKEAGILNTLKGHRNVAEFLRFCQDPYAIMMEYSWLDFSPLGVDKKVSALEDFVTSPRFTSPRFTSPRFTSPRFTIPPFTSPRFTSPRFTSPRFTSPRFTSPVQSSPVQCSPHRVQRSEVRAER